MSGLTTSARRFWGTTASRIHVVGPERSGTTLMLELLVNGFGVNGYSPIEQSVLDVPNPLPSGIYCSKCVIGYGDD